MDKKKLKQELATALRNEMSGTGTGASVTAGAGEGVATKYAFGKSNNKGTPKDWKAAPSIPNRPSKAMDYKELWEDFKVGDKVTYLGHPGEITAINKEMTGDITYNVLNDKGTGKTKVTNVWNKGGEIKPLKEIDINDPVLMKIRASSHQKSLPKPEPTKNPDFKAGKNFDKIKMLLKQRDQVMSDMEQEAEPEGGPIADRYGSVLNRIDKALATLKGQGEWGPETNPYMDKAEIERRAAMLELDTKMNNTSDKIHIGTDTKTDSDVYFEPATGTFSINVIDAAGNRTNKLQVNTIDDVLAKFPNWKWTREGEIEFQPEEQDDDEGTYDWFTNKNIKEENTYDSLKSILTQLGAEEDSIKVLIKAIEMGALKPSDAVRIVKKALSKNNESLQEGYARFRNETKTRTKPEQFHSAVKQVKQKVNEINRLFEYMNRLQSELSESEGGLKYKKYTEKSIQQIKESTKSLFFKSTKLK